MAEDEIDLLALVKYLWGRRIIILVVTAIPILTLLLAVAFRAQSFSDRSVEAILFIPGTAPVQLERIISAQLIRDALDNSRIDIDVNAIVSQLEVKPGYGALNRPLDLSLAKLSGQQTPGRTEKPEKIRQRYDNLVANRDRFFTLLFHLKASPLDKGTARILLSEMVRLFNERMESQQYNDQYPLGQIDAVSGAQLEPLSAFSANQILGSVQALKAANRELSSRGFNRKGYNARTIVSRLDYVTIQLEAIISSSDRLTRFFLIELERQIETAREKIKSLDRVLANISNGDNSGLYSTSSGQQRSENGMMSAEYNAELFDRFLTIGAELSLVDYQEQLVKERLDLEFELATNEEMRRSLGKIRLIEKDLEKNYRNIIDEVASLTDLINGYLRDYRRNYSLLAVDLITLNDSNPSSLLNAKIVGLLASGAFGLAIMGLLVFKALQ